MILASSLHVVHGDAMTPVLKRAGISGHILPHRDVLCEGEVPPWPFSARLNARVRVIAETGWATAAEAHRHLAPQYQTLARADAFSSIYVWFDPDLHDQLQLIECLAAFAEQDGLNTPIFLVQLDDFACDMTGSALWQLYEKAVPVKRTDLNLAQRYWAAFTSREADDLQQVLYSNAPQFPYLKSAFLRLMEEFPDPATGLSRSERQILAVVRSGCTDFATIFWETQRMEACPFAGDVLIQLHLQRLAQGACPLLVFEGGWKLTATGYAVLSGAARWTSPRRFLGGKQVGA